MNSLVIVPTYNESENLALLAPVVLETYPTIDVLVVVDGSPKVPGSRPNPSPDSNYQQKGVLSK